MITSTKTNRFRSHSTTFPGRNPLDQRFRAYLSLTFNAIRLNGIEERKFWKIEICLCVGKKKNTKRAEDRHFLRYRECTPRERVSGRRAREFRLHISLAFANHGVLLPLPKQRARGSLPPSCHLFRASHRTCGESFLRKEEVNRSGYNRDFVVLDLSGCETRSIVA